MAYVYRRLGYVIQTTTAKTFPMKSTAPKQGEYLPIFLLRAARIPLYLSNYTSSWWNDHIKKKSNLFEFLFKGRIFWWQKFKCIFSLSKQNNILSIQFDYTGKVSWGSGCHRNSTTLFPSIDAAYAATLTDLALSAIRANIVSCLL